MSMAKGLLPDDHEQSAGPARSLVLKESDVVMMVGARLNWLLSHGKGKNWGDPHQTKFIQLDIDPKEMDSNIEIAAPLVGDIESCLTALMDAMGSNWQKPPSAWLSQVKEWVQQKRRALQQGYLRRTESETLPRPPRRGAAGSPSAAVRLFLTSALTTLRLPSFPEDPFDSSAATS